MEQFLDQLIQSLNRIETRGEDNLNILLGCILACKKMRASLNAPQETEENNGR